MWQEHYLMSLDTPLLKVEMLPSDGTIGRVMEVYNNKLLPYSVDGSRDTLADWSRSRRIPASRKHMKTFRYKDKLDYLLYNSMYLSLSDSFWVKPVTLRDSWKDVNFFDNDFSDDVGEWLMSGEGRLMELKSPSNSTDGVFPKKWIIIDGMRALAKQGDRDNYQYDDVSEIVACELLQILTKNNKVPYATYFRADNMTCATWNFIKPGQNLISAGRYLMHNSCDPEYSTKDICMQTLKSSMAWESIETMLILDYIVFNVDRHFGNFGFIQDAKTGEILNAAPIFDTGSSLFAAIGAGYRGDILNRDFTARPFAPTHDSQIKFAHVKKYRQEIEKVKSKVSQILYDRYGEAGVKENFVEQLCVVVQQRVDFLLERCMG